MGLVDLEDLEDFVVGLMDWVDLVYWVDLVGLANSVDPVVDPVDLAGFVDLVNFVDWVDFVGLAGSTDSLNVVG